MNDLLRTAQDVFRARFGGMPEAYSYAPARVEILGNHTDYNDGFVVSAAIDRHVVVCGRPISSSSCTLFSCKFSSQVEFPVNKIQKLKDDEFWANYVAGVIWKLLDMDNEIGGFQAVIASDIPLGSGLSSSAALEVASALFLQQIFRFEMDRLTIARVCQAAENEFVGVNCGILDQYSVVFGETGCLLFLDCRNLGKSSKVFLKDGVSIVIVNSKAKHELADGTYNRLREECFQAASILNEVVPDRNITHLRDVNLLDLEKYGDRLPERLMKRALHVVEENDRVQKLVDALGRNDIESVGKQMLQSHGSSRNNFQNSCKELDLLVALARELDGCYGCRLTGGGFGGCTVNLVVESAEKRFIRDLSASYNKETGFEAECLVCHVANGATSGVPPDVHYENLHSFLPAGMMTKKILVVGAGGIGCELLKTLALSGFCCIDVLDLDTIDASNLNRQFLFSRGDVGHSKSTVAVRSVMKFANPQAKMDAFEGDIAQYSVGDYNLVFSALDNDAARRELHRRCVASDVPLVESGTGGYSGQVYSTIPKVTECFHCRPHASAVTYPFCILKANPSTIVHCVQWASSVFDSLFGENVEGNEGEIASMTDLNASSFRDLDILDFAKRVFEQFFDRDVQWVLSLKEDRPAWVRGPPRRLSIGIVEVRNFCYTPISEQIWSLEENITAFVKSSADLFKRWKSVPNSFLEWNKDEEIMMVWMTAASNLRAACFHIEAHSGFEIKGLAGNIIPAIASTNAIAAGLMVLEARKILMDPSSSKKLARKQLISQKNTMTYKRKDCVIMPVTLDPPNKECFCSRANITCCVDPISCTLKELKDDVVRKLHISGYVSISVGHTIIFEEDEEERSMDMQLSKTLRTLGIENGTVIDVEDEDGNSFGVVIHASGEPKKKRRRVE